MRRAAIFDVFGTCVDWRNSVAREVANVLPEADALAFADAWRGEYQPAMERIRDGGRGYVALDILHRENLDIVLDRFGVSAPDPEALNRAWQKLDPWPDVVEGLNSLRQSHLIAPCSNGSVALMTRLARYAKFPWDCIAGAELARDYKPKRDVYLKSCAALGLPPAQVTMVAAHNDDLEAAKDAGLRTAFVARPTEYGPAQSTDLTPTGDWDVVASDFIDLASKL
jgi:2-haloacid dehalogenase